MEPHDQPSIPPTQPATSDVPTAPVRVISSPVEAQSQSVPHKEPTNAGLLVLQWLTYAFWGWTVLALSVLATTVLANLIEGADTAGFTPYGIAAVLVLLPISFVCDHFYSKKEPQKKTGPETLVMVIHAVLFALFGIGSLIFAVFSLVQLGVGSGDSSSAVVGLLSSLIIAVFYAFTFLRTLNPGITPWIRRYYKFGMLAAISVIAVMALVGPVAQERRTRDDRLIRENLNSIESGINEYARTNNRLPDSLELLTFSYGDVETLIERDLVEYKPVGAVTSRTSVNSLRNFNNDLSIVPQEYRYELCVTYKEEAPSRNGYGGSDVDSEGYTTYLSTYNHPAGRVCYKLRTTDY